MKKTIYDCDFSDMFYEYGREDNFSYEGRNALYDFLTEMEDETGEEIEVDIVGLCREFTEYDNLEDFQSDYGEEYESIEDIERSTIVIPVDDERFIIQAF